MALTRSSTERVDTWIVLADPILKAFGQEAQLQAVDALNETTHGIRPDLNGKIRADSGQSDSRGFTRSGSGRADQQHEGLAVFSIAARRSRTGSRQLLTLPGTMKTFQKRLKVKILFFGFKPED
jgi:hypothetical protein